MTQNRFRPSCAKTFGAMLMLAASFASPGSLWAGDSEVVVESAADGLNHTAFKFDGIWLSSTAKSKAPGLRATTSMFNTADTSKGAAKFQPSLPVAGKYEVFVTFSQSANAKAVAYKITSDDGEKRIEIDQNGLAPASSPDPQPNKWVSLGQYNFQQGTAGSVEIYDPLTGEGANSKEPNKRLYADAVKWVPVGFTLPPDYVNKGAIAAAPGEMPTLGAASGPSASAPPSLPPAGGKPSAPPSLPPTAGAASAPPSLPPVNAPAVMPSLGAAADNTGGMPSLGAASSQPAANVPPPSLPSGAPVGSAPPSLPAVGAASSMPSLGAVNPPSGGTMPSLGAANPPSGGTMPSLSASSAPSEPPSLPSAGAGAPPSLGLPSVPAATPEKSGILPADSLPSLGTIVATPKPKPADSAKPSLGALLAASGSDAPIAPPPNPSLGATLAASDAPLGAPAKVTRDDDQSGIQWMYDYGAGLNSARAQNKNALVFFTARGNKAVTRYETEILRDPAVRAALDKFVLVRIDFPTNTRLAYRLNIFGAGQLVLMDPNDSRIGSITQLPSSPAEFVQKLESLK